MNDNQRKQIEDARREAIEKTYNVCADGEKKKSDYDEFSNEVNNE